MEMSFSTFPAPFGRLVQREKKKERVENFEKGAGDRGKEKTGESCVLY